MYKIQTICQYRQLIIDLSGSINTKYWYATICYCHDERCTWHSSVCCFVSTLLDAHRILACMRTSSIPDLSCRKRNRPD